LISFDEPSEWMTTLVKMHCSQLYQKEGKESKISWQAEGRSYLGIYGHGENLGWIDTIVVIVYSLIGKSWRGHKWFKGIGIVDIISSSTICMSYLLDHSKGFNLKNVKTFGKWSFISARQNKGTSYRKKVDGNEYLEVIYENHLAAAHEAMAQNNNKKKFHVELFNI
jgi:hypothetical protein